MSSFVAPKTFRAAVVNEVGGKFELETREWVNPKAGEVVVKMLACVSAGLDCCPKSKSI